jgi:hypothetical protein
VPPGGAGWRGWERRFRQLGLCTAYAPTDQYRCVDTRHAANRTISHDIFALPGRAFIFPLLTTTHPSPLLTHEARCLCTKRASEGHEDYTREEKLEGPSNRA